MRKMIFSLVAIWGILFAPVSLFAHPGHGVTEGHTITHYLTEPVHAIAIFSALVIIAGYLFYRFSAKNKSGEVKIK